MGRIFKVDAAYTSGFGGHRCPAGMPQSIRIEMAIDANGHDALVLARLIAAQFPKMVGLRGGTCSRVENGERISQAYIHLYINLVPNGSNKGINETGVKRYRSFVRTCGRLGYEIEYCAPFGNSYATREEFERAIS